MYSSPRRLDGIGLTDNSDPEKYFVEISSFHHVCSHGHLHLVAMTVKPAFTLTCPHHKIMQLNQKGCENYRPFLRSRPNWSAGPSLKSGSARKSESRGPKNGVSRWRRPNSDIYSQNDHFGLVYDMIYQFPGMEAKNYKFSMFCQQCHPSADTDIRPRNASRIHTCCHLFTS